MWFISSSLKTLFDYRLLESTGFVTKIIKQKGTVDMYIHGFKSIFVKNSNTEVDSGFMMDLYNLQTIYCETPKELKILKGVALPQIM